MKDQIEALVGPLFTAGKWAVYVVLGYVVVKGGWLAACWLWTKPWLGH